MCDNALTSNRLRGDCNAFCHSVIQCVTMDPQFVTHLSDFFCRVTKSVGVTKSVPRFQIICGHL